MKLAGYRAGHRNRWLLVKNRVLTLSEFLLLEYYIDMMDFDQKHEKFGTFEVFLDEVAKIFGRKEDTIRKWHKGLVSKDFIQLFEKRRKLFKIKAPLRYLTGEAWGGKAAQYAREEKNRPLDSLLENVQFSPREVEKNQKSNSGLADNNSPKPPSNPSKALGSSKGRYKVTTDEEYQRIHRELHFEHLTPEDLRWIDENVKEKVKR